MIQFKAGDKIWHPDGRQMVLTFKRELTGVIDRRFRCEYPNGITESSCDLTREEMERGFIGETRKEFKAGQKIVTRNDEKIKILAEHEDPTDDGERQWVIWDMDTQSSIRIIRHSYLDEQYLHDYEEPKVLKFRLGDVIKTSKSFRENLWIVGRVTQGVTECYYMTCLGDQPSQGFTESELIYLNAVVVGNIAGLR